MRTGQDVHTTAAAQAAPEMRSISILTREI